MVPANTHARAGDPSTTSLGYNLTVFIEAQASIFTVWGLSCLLLNSLPPLPLALSSSPPPLFPLPSKQY